MGIRTGQLRLQRIATNLNENRPISQIDLNFLVMALSKIANGENAELSLGVKAKKGERKGPYARTTKVRNQFIFGLIATAIAPQDEHGLGLSLKDAVSMIKNAVRDLPAEETIRRYWNDARHKTTRDFEIKTD